MECVPSKGGGFIVTFDVANDARPDRAFIEVAARALAATAKP